MSRSKLVVTAWLAGLAFFGGGGVWAFADPAGFYDTIATFPPLNEHFLRDIGSFELGIAAALVVGWRTRSGALVALFGASVASVVHAVSHLIDRNEGGRGIDHLLFWGLSILLVAATYAQAREERRAT